MEGVCDPTKNEVTKSSLFAFAALVGTLVFLVVKPIPLPCVGCDTGGSFYRCMDGTGLNSVTCDAYRAGEDGVNKLKGSVMSVSEYAKELTKFSSRLPAYLTEFAQTIKTFVIKISAEIYARVKTIATYAAKKMKEIRKMVLDPIKDTWQTVYETVIRPMITAFMKYIVQPVTALLDKIMSFARLVIEEVTAALEKGGHIVSEAYDAVYDASEKLAEIIEDVMRQSAHSIESMVKGIQTGLNVSMKAVIGSTETVVNNITGVIDDAANIIEKSVNTTVSGVVKTTNDTVNTIGAGISGVARDAQDGINTGLRAITKVAETGINTITQTTDDAVNTMGGSVASAFGSVMNETESIVNELSDVVENSVNGTIELINTKISHPVEKVVNGASDIVENSIADLMSPIKGITDGLNKIAGWEIDAKIFRVRPLAFMKINAPLPGRVNVPHIDIPNLDKIDIPHVNLPDVTYEIPPDTTKALGSIAPYSELKRNGSSTSKAAARERLTAAIRRAEKNWKIAASETTQTIKERNTPGRSAYACSADLSTYAHAKQKRRNYSFMPNSDLDNQTDLELDPEGEYVQHEGHYYQIVDGSPIPLGIVEHEGQLYRQVAGQYKPLGAWHSFISKPVAKAVNKTADFFDDTAAKTKAAFEKAAEETKQAFEKAARETKELAEKAARETKELAEKAAREAKELAEKAAREAKELAEKAAKAALELIIKGIRDAEAKADREAAEATAAAQAELAAAEARSKAAEAAYAQKKIQLQLIVAQQKAVNRAAADARKVNYTRPRAPIKIKGINIPDVSMQPPQLKFTVPDMQVNLKVDPISIKEPGLKLKPIPVPVLQFAPTNLDEKVPDVPNIMDGVSAAGNAVQGVLKDFFAPVWKAIGVLFGYVNTVVTSVMHFYKNEVTWAKVRDGVLSALQKGKAGLVEVIHLIYDEVVLPFIAVVKWIGGHLVATAKQFTKMALAFLGRLRDKVFELSEAVWTKVKPLLRETALVGAGVASFSVGALLNTIPPFKWLPMTTTSKIYTAVVLSLLLLFGAQVRFFTRYLGGAMKLALTPLMAADNLLENWVSKHPGGRLGTFSRAMGFNAATYKPACWIV
jgi:hypothetical protein